MSSALIAIANAAGCAPAIEKYVEANTSQPIILVLKMY